MSQYKRPLDLVGVLLGVLFFLPFWLLIGTFIPLLIWLEDRGPVFYSQNRIGQGGKAFRLHKFRSMNQSQGDNEPTILAIENDPRITRVGRILRRTALDELPQVLAILQGHMSLVGPRPEPLDISEQLLSTAPDAHRRLLVKPGLTGLAQVYGGYGAALSEKLRYDLLYVDGMGLRLDLQLILLSVVKTLWGKWESAVSNKQPQQLMENQAKKQRRTR